MHIKYLNDIPNIAQQFVNFEFHRYNYDFSQIQVFRNFLYHHFDFFGKFSQVLLKSLTKQSGFSNKSLVYPLF